MRQKIRKWRLWFAQWCLLGTDYCVCRDEEIIRLRSVATSMLSYAHRSGGLREPRRIKAYRKIVRYGEALSASAHRAVVS